MEVVHKGFRMLVPDATSSDDVDVARVLLRTYELYLERNSERKAVWKNSGLKGQTFNIFSKAERAFHEIEHGELPNMDNYLDGILYNVFGAILRAEEDVYGTWPWARS